MLALSSENRLLETLKQGLGRLVQLVNDFTVMAKLVRMKLVCFYEMYETKLGTFGVGVKTLIRYVPGGYVDAC